MSKKKDYAEIMQEITSGLTGDPREDFGYLNNQMERYRDHELSREIIRACGRLLYDLMPEDAKQKMAEAEAKDNEAIETRLEEVRFNVFKKDINKALSIIEGMVKDIEAAKPFQDDQVSEYHTFGEPFEEILYRYLYKPTKEIRQATINMAEIYYNYGAILVELQRYDEARNALETALKWNPVRAQILFEYLEILNREKDYEEFYRKTIEAFKIAFNASDVARCYRNLGFYYVERKIYDAAIACYRLSGIFEPDAKQIQSELYYISTVTNDTIKEPTKEDLNILSEQYGFPLSADKDILGLSYTYGQEAYDHKDYGWAGYFWSIAYGISFNSELKEKLDEIDQYFIDKEEEEKKYNSPGRLPVSEIKNQDNWNAAFKAGFPFWEAGEEARKTGKYEEAIGLFDKARNNGLLTPALYKSYAMTYRKLKDVENEVNILEEGLQRIKEARSGDYSSGVAELQKQLDKAKQRLKG